MDTVSIIKNRAVFQRCKTKLLNNTTDPALAKMLREQLDRFTRIVHQEQQDFFFQIIAQEDNEKSLPGEEKEKDKIRIGIIRETMRTMSKIKSNEDCVQRLANEGLLIE